MRLTPLLLWLVFQTSVAGAQAGAPDAQSMVGSGEIPPDVADPTGGNACNRDEYRDSKHEAVCNMLQAWESGDWAEARRNAEIVHAVKPTARTWLFLAKCDYKLEQYAGAIVQCERALQRVDRGGRRVGCRVPNRHLTAHRRAASRRVEGSSQALGRALDRTG